MIEKFYFCWYGNCGVSNTYMEIKDNKIVNYFYGGNVMGIGEKYLCYTGEVQNIKKCGEVRTIDISLNKQIIDKDTIKMDYEDNCLSDDELKVIENKKNEYNLELNEYNKNIKYYEASKNETKYILGKLIIFPQIMEDENEMVYYSTKSDTFFLSELQGCLISEHNYKDINQTFETNIFNNLYYKKYAFKN